MVGFLWFLFVFNNGNYGSQIFYYFGN